MSDAPRRAPVRPAAVLNARIRQLWARAAGRRLTDAERDEYARLVAAFTAAERGELVKAA